MCGWREEANDDAWRSGVLQACLVAKQSYDLNLPLHLEQQTRLAIREGEVTREATREEGARPSIHKNGLEPGVSRQINSVIT
jgi:hypothetical protein